MHSIQRGNSGISSQSLLHLLFHQNRRVVVFALLVAMLISMLFLHEAFRFCIDKWEIRGSSATVIGHARNEFRGRCSVGRASRRNPQYRAAKNALYCTNLDTPSLEKRAFGRVMSAARSLATHTSVPLLSGLTLPCQLSRSA